MSDRTIILTRTGCEILSVKEAKCLRTEEAQYALTPYSAQCKERPDASVVCLFGVSLSLRSPMYTFILSLPFDRCGCSAELGMWMAWDTTWERKIPPNEAPANDLTILWLNTVLVLKLLQTVFLTTKIWKGYFIVIRAETFNSAFIFFRRSR